MSRAGAEIQVASRLEADPSTVWSRVTTPEGINDEMRPIMRMTTPAGVDRLDLNEVDLGTPIGRSWILLFGLIPFDFDEITLVEVDPGRGFLERSQMLSQRVWEHERTIEPDGTGCVVTDRVRWVPRFGLVPAGMLRPVIRGFFSHRHRRLRMRFGGELLVEGT